MPRTAVSVVQLAMVAVLWGCASQAGSASSADETAFVPCAVRAAAPTDSVPWREVRGDGFTFCVPGDWRADGPDKWRGDGGTISLSGERGERIPITVSRMGSGRPTRGVGAGVPVVLPSDHRDTMETIGGELVRLTTFRSASKYGTMAEWTSGLVRFAGSAVSEKAAERHLEIYRTVRPR